MRDVLAVGWDVGGWRGNKQAVAVLQRSEANRWWLGSATTFDLGTLHRAGGRPLDLIRFAWPAAPDDVLEQFRVVIAIDAPLGFPIAFQRLVSGMEYPVIDLGPEITNPFAYRETERWVYRVFGKKPLSASFDKLGNNATAAIYHARSWAKDLSFAIVPFQSDTGNQHVIIEVYPALVKHAATGTCLPPLAWFLPDDLPAGTDQYDASICAILASYYDKQLDCGDVESLRLVRPPSSEDAEVLATEGWIYTVPPEALT